MKLLTIENYQKLNGIFYNNRWKISEVKEEIDRYIFLFESEQKDETIIEIVRRRNDGGKWLARYRNEWFFLTKEDFKSPDNLVKAFRNF